MTPEFRQLELLVAKIQQQLAPKAEVIHNAKMMGRLTKINRQIDVLVRERIGQYEINIVIDCKDYSSPADVKDVEEFRGLLEDVGAQKGVLVCPKGFSSTAKVRAEGLQIELYSPVDTDIHKWTVKASIPATCEFRNVWMSFGITHSSPIPFTLPNDFYDSRMVFDEDGTELGLMATIAKRKWNKGIFPSSVGEHRDLYIFDSPKTLMDNGYGMKSPVGLTVSLYVERELYFGQLPVPRISGFKDECSGMVITNAFTVGIISPEEVERDWTKIESEEQAPLKPVIALMGAVVWAEDGHEL